MARRPIASRSELSCGIESISFFPELISGRILAARVGTRERWPLQNKQRCSVCAALLSDTAVTITEKAPDFAALEPYVEKVLQLLLKEKEMHLVNVNLPEKPKGIRWTRQAVKQVPWQSYSR